MSVQLEAAAVLPYQPHLCALGPLRYTSERPAVTPVYHRQPARPRGPSPQGYPVAIAFLSRFTSEQQFNDHPRA
jgi:hypothetical protein